MCEHLCAAYVAAPHDPGSGTLPQSTWNNSGHFIFATLH